MKQLLIHAFSPVITKLGIIVFILFPVLQTNAQTIGIDSLPVKELMYVPVLRSIQIPIHNISEDGILTYQSHIEYKRKPKEITIQESLEMKEVENLQYNSVLQYADTAFLSAAYGNPDFSPVTVATRFTARNNGFNLSGVGTWFIPGTINSGVIHVEIRAGGNSINDAIIVSQGSIQFEIKQNEINGHFYNIELEKEVSLYPNEDFYVLFTYPGSIARPQGCAVNDIIDVVEGRYWVKIDGEFVDLQTIEGYSNGAWLMYAAEKSPKNIGWLSFERNSSGLVQAEYSTFVSMQMNGLVADLGSQYADLVILSNDTLNPEVRVPIELRLNEAPYFIDASSDIFIKEKSFSEINITVRDLEGDNFKVMPVMGCKFVQFSLNDSILTLYISPDKGDEGDYTIRFVATDEYNMSRELNITIYVLPNQSPAFVDPPAEISVEETKVLDVFINAYDPENDYFTISLTNYFDFITSSFNYPEFRLHLSPKIGDAGEYTLLLRAEDVAGSVNELLIPLHVLPKNRPPVYIGDGSPIVFSFMDNLKTFNINDFFTDLDNDAFTFEIFCQNINVVEVTIDNITNFSLKPKSVGITVLDFVLTDARGEQSNYSIEVIVGLCERPDEIIIQKWNKVLLVNNYSGEYAPDGYQWYRNGIPVKNATRQDYSSEEDTGGLLDFSSEYFARIVKLNGDTIYTCPYIPKQKTDVMRVYPNPVAKSASLYIENEPDDSGSGIVQIMDILGHIQKTIQIDSSFSTVQMPDIPGLYIVKIVYGDNKNVFRIKVY